MPLLFKGKIGSKPPTMPIIHRKWMVNHPIFFSPPRLSAFTGLGLGKLVMVSKIGNLWFIYG